MTQLATLWTSTVVDRTLVVMFPTLYRVLSWAPLNGGFCHARSILNHQVCTDEYPTEEPGAFLAGVARHLAIAEPAVGLMTGVLMERLVKRAFQRQDFALECFATVGVSNALAVGDPATYDEKPGTINVIIAVNRPLTDAALVEAVAIVTEAKTRALSEARIKSTVSEAPATGTGTDCVALACPVGAPMFHYCGKHTGLGEFVGRAAYEAIVEGLRHAGAHGHAKRT